MNDFLMTTETATAFSLLPEKDQERFLDRAAKDLLSHPMRSRAFFKRCEFDFLTALKKELDAVVEDRQEALHAEQQEQLLADIQSLADRMGISLEEALKGIKLDNK